MQRGAGGRNRFHCTHGDILEFQRDDIAGAGKARQRRVVIIAGLPVLHGNSRSRGVIFRAEYMHIKTELARRARQHPAQLSAAKDPDHGAGWQGSHPSGTSATPSVWAAR